MTLMDPKVAITPEQCAQLEREYLEAIASLNEQIKKLVEAKTVLFGNYESVVAAKASSIIDDAANESLMALRNALAVVDSISEYRKFVEEH